MASLSRGRILLVDDETGDLRSHARALGDAGFEVTPAAGGTDAAGLVERDRFDVVLTELSLPGRDGASLVRELRKRDRDLPVVLMMGDASSAAARAAMKQGAVECVSRSIATNALQRTVERVVRVSRRRRIFTAYRNRRGEEVEIESFTATDAKNEFGRVLEAASHDGIVVITRRDEPEAVLLSFDEFKDLAGSRERKLEELSAEFDGLLAKMQTSTARKGMKAAFDASPARMGEAAVAASRKRG